MPREYAKRGTITAQPRVQFRLSIAKAPFVAADGYRRALQRMDRAITDSDHDGVVISLTETIHWLTTYAEQVPDVAGRDDVRAVISGPATALTTTSLRSLPKMPTASIAGDRRLFCPVPAEARFEDKKGEVLYVRHLENRAVVDVFKGLERVMGPEPH